MDCPLGGSCTHSMSPHLEPGPRSGLSYPGRGHLIGQSLTGGPDMDLGSGQTSRVSVVELGTRYVRSHWVVTAEAPMRGGRKDLGQWVGKEGEGYRDTSDLKQTGLGDRLNMRRENTHSAKDNWCLLAAMDSSGDRHGLRAQWG